MPRTPPPRTGNRFRFHHGRTGAGLVHHWKRRHGRHRPPQPPPSADRGRTTLRNAPLRTSFSGAGRGRHSRRREPSPALPRCRTAPPASGRRPPETPRPEDAERARHAADTAAAYRRPFPSPPPPPRTGDRFRVHHRRRVPETVSESTTAAPGRGRSSSKRRHIHHGRHQARTGAERLSVTLRSERRSPPPAGAATAAAANRNRFRFHHRRTGTGLAHHWKRRHVHRRRHRAATAARATLRAWMPPFPS